MNDSNEWPPSSLTTRLRAKIVKHKIEIDLFPWPRSHFICRPTYLYLLGTAFTRKIPGYVPMRTSHLLDTSSDLFFLKFRIFTYENYEDTYRIYQLKPLLWL